MAERKRPRGTCAYCGLDYTKGGIFRHLRACGERQSEIAAAAEEGRQAEELYHLRVEDAWGGDYWLNLEVRGSATLKDLDDYLRAIWLECCGHMSQFSIGGWSGDEIPMSRKIADVFEPDLELTHIYDFGTSSHTLVRMAEMRRGAPITTHPIELMARNNPPEVMPCMECQEQGAWLCLECAYEYDRPGTLCDKHVENHPHDAYGAPLPIVNSPRLGMCGYVGPAEPPY